MTAFLFFTPASKRWLGSRKTEIPEETAWVDFVTLVVQSYFDTVLRWTKRGWSYMVRITMYLYTVMCLLRNSNLSQIYGWKQWICRTCILSLRGNKTQSINKQDERINSLDSYPVSPQPSRVSAFLVTERPFTTISEPGTGYLINSRSMDDYRNSPIFLCWRIPN